MYYTYSPSIDHHHHHNFGGLIDCLTSFLTVYGGVKLEPVVLAYGVVVWGSRVSGDCVHVGERKWCVFAATVPAM